MNSIGNEQLNVIKNQLYLLFWFKWCSHLNKDDLLNRFLSRQMLRWTDDYQHKTHRGCPAIREWGAQLRQPLDSIRWRARAGVRQRGCWRAMIPKHPLPLPPTPISIHALSLTMRTRAPGRHCLLYHIVLRHPNVYWVNRAEIESALIFYFLYELEK